MIIKPRLVFKRDPPFDAKGALAEVRRLTGWGSGELFRILNVPRSTLAGWEVRGNRPNVDDGDAIRKLLAQVIAERPNCDTFDKSFAAESRACRPTQML